MNSSTVALFSFVPSWQLSWAISGLDWLMSSSINPTWLSKLFVVSHPTVLIGHFCFGLSILGCHQCSFVVKMKSSQSCHDFNQFFKKSWSNIMNLKTSCSFIISDQCIHFYVTIHLQVISCCPYFWYY